MAKHIKDITKFGAALCGAGVLKQDYPYNDIDHYKNSKDKNKEKTVCKKCLLNKLSTQ